MIELHWLSSKLKSLELSSKFCKEKREAHSVETPLKHGLRGEIFRQFAEWRLYLHMFRIWYQDKSTPFPTLPVFSCYFLKTSHHIPRVECHPISNFTLIILVEDIYPMAVYARSVSLLAYQTVVYTDSDIGLACPPVVYTRSTRLLVYPTALYMHYLCHS